MLQLESVTKSYGDTVLFQDINLHIKPLMRLGLIGANGVGKTTLLRVIEGTEPVTSGRVHCRGDLRLGHVTQEVETLGGESILQETLSVFPELDKLNAQLVEITRQLSTDPENVRLLKKLGALQEILDQHNLYSLETRAKSILGGLGFQQKQFNRSLDTLSGGWKMRVALAKVLLAEPDLLLLDEPTNHLDLESLIWLENVLKEYKGALVLISHDRTFINTLATHIGDMSWQKLTVFTGNYEKYEQHRQQQYEYLLRQARNQEKQAAQLERFIERFRAKNTLATRVKSKIKQLNRMERITIQEEEHREFRFTIPEPPRSGLKVITCQNVAKAYGDLVVYDDLNFELERGDKVALVGPNGAGKSTLLKLLAGVIQPESGKIQTGYHVHPAYFAQHQLETLNPKSTIYDTVRAQSDQILTTQLRSYLGAFLFSGDDVNKKVEVLSGGEKARLALAKLFLQPVNFLMMDEPTNHLDIDSQDMLVEVLQQYSGTLVCISHDRSFINNVCTKVVAIFPGSLKVYPGNYDYYIWKQQQTAAEASNSPAEEDSPDREKSSGREAYEERKARQREERRRQRALEKVTLEIERLEKKRDVLTGKLKDPRLAANYVKLQELMAEKDTLEGEIESKYTQWVDMQE